MRPLKIAVWVMLFGATQSCLVAKPYERPEAIDEIVDAVSFRTDELPSDGSLAETSWRHIFGDPTLQAYVEEALANNIDIRVALYQMEIAEAYVRQRRAGNVPEFSVGANFEHTETTAGRESELSLVGGLSWEADIWGRIRSQTRATNAAYLQTMAAHQGVKTRLVASVASAYFQLLALDEQVRITTETIETRQNSVETTKALKEAGTVTEVAVRQTEAQLYTTQAILIDLQRDVRLVENHLCLLLGRACDGIDRSDLESQHMLTTLRAGVPADLLRNRPDVKAAEYAFMEAFELKNVARTSLYPTLRITAEGGLATAALTEFFSPASLFATLGAGITQPIFQQRRLRTEDHVAALRQEQALARFQHALHNASKEVSDALYVYRAASDKIEVMRREYAANAEATEFSQQLLENGRANYLEVLRAQENMLSTSLDLVRAREAQLLAVIDFYAAIGGGWR